jgi:hypothetical protein
MKLSLDESTPRQHIAVLTMAFLVLATANLGAQEPGRRSARDVHLRIETDRPTYRVGDSIAVRLALRNVSPLPVRYVSAPPVVQARLRVYDTNGRQVRPAFPHVLQRSGARPVTLKAGEAVTLKWVSGEWLNLRDWGYELRVPGRYTIVGLPGVVGPELAPDYETVRSNRATITILP